jgi:hypothetical protein
MKVNPEYLEKVKNLNKKEREYLLSRMVGKLPRRIEKERVSIEEALAIQMELEDEQLEEWRKNFKLIKEKDGERLKERGKGDK